MSNSYWLSATRVICPWTFSEQKWRERHMLFLKTTSSFICVILIKHDKSFSFLCPCWCGHLGTNIYNHNPSLYLKNNFKYINYNFVTIYLCVSDLLLDTMNAVDVMGTHEALIYCVGSLKFLTGNATIAKQLVQKQCIENLAALLNSINKLVSVYWCWNASECIWISKP